MKDVARLYIGNSQNMDKIENNSIDFIFTGPPYWNHLKYSNEKMQLGNIDDYELFHLEIAKVWQECYRVLKHGAFLCIQVNDLYVHDGAAIKERIPLVQDFSRHIMQKGFIPVNTIFWDSYLSVKSKKMPKEERQGTRFLHIIPQRMQYLMFFIKQGEGQTQKAKYSSVLTDYYWQPFWKIKTKRKILGSSLIYKFISFIISCLPIEDIMEIPLLKKIKNRAIGDFRKDKKYPAASDDKVVKKILSDFTQAGDLVLDPFAGSGTTLKVASDIRRRCIGYEINKGVGDIIKNRLKGEVDIFNK
ncbi:MAG: site-specific DNA-methyltransferase [Deltaproteobacteria bacterium]|nr:site-specific DNA-methyltransferase [Deltaproteobacteria bacterium]